MTAIPILVAVAGWTGAVMILAAYLLLSARRLAADSVSYQLLNVVGATGFVVNSGYNGALPSAVVNVIWVVIGAVALWRIRRARRHRPGAGQSRRSV